MLGLGSNPEGSRPRIPRAALPMLLAGKLFLPGCAGDELQPVDATEDPVACEDNIFGGESVVVNEQQAIVTRVSLGMDSGDIGVRFNMGEPVTEGKFQGLFGDRTADGSGIVLGSDMEPVPEGEEFAELDYDEATDSGDVWFNTGSEYTWNAVDGLAFQVAAVRDDCMELLGNADCEIFADPGYPDNLLWECSDRGDGYPADQSGLHLVDD